jgi:type IV pilus assembly protein PilA
MRFIDKTWLNLARAAIGGAAVTFCATLANVWLRDKPLDYRGLLAPLLIFLVLFGVPYLVILRKLGKARDPEQRIAAAIPAGLFSAFIAGSCIYLMWEAFLDETWGPIAFFALFALLHLCLLVSAAGLYFSAQNRAWDWNALAWGFWLTLPAMLIMLIGLRMGPRGEPNESIAVGSLRTLYDAELQFEALHPEKGFSRTIAELGPSPGAGLIDPVLASSMKHHYLFVFTPGTPSAAGTTDKYSISCRPRRYNRDGTRSFFTDATGVIRYTTEDRAANSTDPAL